MDEPGTELTPTPLRPDHLQAMEYEDFVRLSFETLLCAHVGTVHKHRVYEGRRTGHQHDIDVSIDLEVGGLRILILVECKKYRRRVEISDLLEFAQRIDDIGASKGVVVSTIGFQKGALKVASAHRIALVTTAPEWHWISHCVVPHAGPPFCVLAEQSQAAEPSVTSEPKQIHPIDKEDRPHTTLTFHSEVSFAALGTDAAFDSAWEGIVTSLRNDAINRVRFRPRCPECGRENLKFHVGVCKGCLARIDGTIFSAGVTWAKCACSTMIHFSEISEQRAECGRCGHVFNVRLWNEKQREELRQAIDRTLWSTRRSSSLSGRGICGP